MLCRATPAGYRSLLVQNSSSSNLFFAMNNDAATVPNDTVAAMSNDTVESVPLTAYFQSLA
ncbi:hypothetical protein DY000_02015833 [Brassica cretica]|uniref:Uncharacterized protein n=1 Tax=Brassica cretica TaxID=69181 RepID=A0ABQ7CN75_BRACR|nr:hypothetical protein DY000_02015833 [Brassica cretica]